MESVGSTANTHSTELSTAPPPHEAATPLLNAATRWRTYLHTRSTAFRSLQEERERGWQSAAMDAWYARRQTHTTPPAQKNAGEGNATTSTPPLQAAKSTGTSGLGATSFAEADVAALAERYRQHARRITRLAAPDFFALTSESQAPSASTANTAAATPALSAARPLFLDLGCAPGGVSKYLLEDLHWQGVGVTLASANGGIEVDPTLVATEKHARDFVLLDGDVTQPSSSWRRSAAYTTTTTHAGVQPAGEDPRLVRAEMALRGSERTAPHFHFVNGGAVLDHGQRDRWEKAVASAANGAAASAPTVEEQTTFSECSGDGSSQSTKDVTSSGFVAPILPWFSLLVPQMTTALENVADGGAVMLVHGAPHCASLFILLRCLDDVFGVTTALAAAGTTSSAQSCRVHLLETMHLAKPPVYVLWTHVRSGSRKLDTVDAPVLLSEASRQDAQRCLLESLNPLSPRVSPLPTSTAAQMPEVACASSISCSSDASPSRQLREEKQRFWMGESDEGYRLAVEGFERHGAQAEAIWARVEAFLRKRRERAEWEMKGSGAVRNARYNRNNSNGARGKQRNNAEKRMRDGAD